MAEKPPERLGFQRTLMLAFAAGLFGFFGVLVADRIIHYTRQSKS